MTQQQKGQTATEYLIILAVVIIIALIAIGVLSGIPSIGGGAQRSTISSYWETSEIGVASMSVGAALKHNITYCDSAAIFCDGNGTITLRNNRANPIIIENVTLIDVSSNHLDFDDTRAVLNAGSTRTFVFHNLSNSGEPGESFSYRLRVNYVDSATGARYMFVGSDNVLVGTIADSLN